jgi:hypothetical protein
VGFLASAVVHVYSLFGAANPFGPAAWALHVGIFVVWFPTVLVAQQLTKNVKQADFWKAVLRGCPPWVRRGAYILFPYAIVNFFAGIVLGASNGFNEFRIFSGHWMIFYYVGAATLYSAQRLGPLANRTCPQGHAASPFAHFCEECGAQLPPATF